MATSVGILGLGIHVPDQVRTNDWWPEDEVARWREQMAHRATASDAPMPAALAPGTRRTLAAMAEIADDPFRGAVERRIMSGTTTASEMEAAAARQALARAGIEPGDVDVILGASLGPEYLCVNHACMAHALLGLRETCLAIATETACNAFALHASLARALVASGTARHVLSVHSSAYTRVQGARESHSPWFGDGAAAAVFGPVSDGHGLLAASHHADGGRCDALVLGVPGKRWWEDGPTYLHAVNRDSTRNMLLGMVDRGNAAVRDALAQAGLAPLDVDYYATHQSTAWLTRETKALAGLDRAQTIVTFPTFGNMSSVNVPFILALGEREGMVRDGSVVATFSGGIGESWSGLVFRWGR